MKHIGLVCLGFSTVLACSGPPRATPQKTRATAPSSSNSASNAANSAHATKRIADKAPEDHYAVEELVLTEQPALAIRNQAAPDQMQKQLSAAIPRLIAHAFSHKLDLAGPPFVRYYTRSAQNIDYEAGVPVAKRGPGTGDIAATALPAGPAIATVHAGPYEGLPRAHKALTAWAERAGRRVTGAPWEVFLTNPLAEPDATKWRTKVFLPVAR